MYYHQPVYTCSIVETRQIFNHHWASMYMYILIYKTILFFLFPKLHSLTYSIRYRIAGNVSWVQIFAIFTDRPVSAKIKTAKNWWRYVHSLVPMWTRWFSTVCLPSKWSLYSRIPVTTQNANKRVRGAPKLLKSRSAGLNPSVQQASFSPTAAVLILT